VNDVINGLFELFGAVMLSMNVRQILHDKQWRGVSWLPFAFFTSWGFWNLIFYPSVDCWLSFTGGLALVTVNVVYCYLLWCYRKN
jgi:hypothetical protein